MTAKKLASALKCSEEEITAIYTTLFKASESARTINCQSCGFGTCEQMVAAIVLGSRSLVDCAHFRLLSGETANSLGDAENEIIHFATIASSLLTPYVTYMESRAKEAIRLLDEELVEFCKQENISIKQNDDVVACDINTQMENFTKRLVAVENYRNMTFVKLYMIQLLETLRKMKQCISILDTFKET